MPKACRTDLERAKEAAFCRSNPVTVVPYNQIAFICPAETNLVSYVIAANWRARTR